MHAATAAANHGVEEGLAAFAAMCPFLSPEEAALLRPYLSVREWAAGEVVMRDGEAGDFLGFLAHGRLAVRKETIFPGKHVLVAFLEPGALVGEVAGVTRGPRNTTVAAIEDSRLFVFATNDLDRLLMESPTLGITLLKRIITVLGTRLHCATDRLAKLL